MNPPTKTLEKRSWFWPWCVVGLLAANMGIVGATIAFALRDPPRVDPTYDSHLRNTPQRDLAPAHPGQP